MGGVGKRAGAPATDRWIDPMMTALVVAWFVAVGATVLAGGWFLVLFQIAALVAVGPVLFVEFDQTRCSVGRFARRRRWAPLTDLRVDVWPGKHGGTLFARVCVVDGRRLVIVRAFGGPGFVERAARTRGVPVRDAHTERLEVPVLPLALTAVIGGSLALTFVANALLR
jgi:hypothetical protein